MSLDTVKMFFQNERNKLIGIGVASCLVTTAIVAPTTYFTGQPKYEGVVKPVAFNTISATGGHLADYGDMELNKDEYGWGNEEYLSYVTTDADLVNNVLDIENGLGFIGKNVAIHEAVTNPKDLNIMSAEFDGEMVDPTDSENYDLVAPINIYMRVPAPVSIFFKDNLMVNSTTLEGEKTIWETDLTTKNLVGWDVDHNEALKSYFNWAYSEKYLDDLLMEFTFFNWMLFTDADAGTNYTSLEGYGNPDSITTTAFIKNVEKMLDNVKNLNDSEKTNEIQFDNSTMFIDIAGTGTDDPFVQAKANTFNTEVLEEIIPKNTYDNEEISIELMSQGSSTAWYMPSEEISFNAGGDNGEWSLEGNGVNSNLPPANAFIGTQSRRSYYGVRGDSISGMSQWGYGYQSTNPKSRSKEWNYMEQPEVEDIESGAIKKDSFGEQKNGDEPYANEVPWMFSDEKSSTESEIMNPNIALPLGFTATTDPLVFFTADDTKFYYQGDNQNPAGNYKPTGMTPEGTKLIFDNPSQEPNITWDFLFSNGFIEAEPLK